MGKFTMQELYSKNYAKSMDIKNYKAVFNEIAKEELENIYKYVSQNLVSKISADRLMERIEECLLRLEQFPYSCPEVKIKPKNLLYRKLIIDNYIAIYSVNERKKQVNIVHIFYSRKDYL